MNCKVCGKSVFGGNSICQNCADSLHGNPLDIMIDVVSIPAVLTEKTVVSPIINEKPKKVKKVKVKETGFPTKKLLIIILILTILVVVAFLLKLYVL